MKSEKDLSVENKILKQAIGAFIDEDVGIYPKKVVGKNGYEKRTEYMDGWNDAVIKHSELIDRVLHDLGIDVEDGGFCLDEPKTIYKE